MGRVQCIIGVFASFLVLCQCTDIRTGDTKNVQLARVGSNYLTLDDAREEIPSFLLKQDSLQSLRNYRENWIREQLLLAEARSLKLEQQETVKKRLANAREEVLKSALKELIITQTSKNVLISDHEIQNYYEQHKEQLQLPERYVRFRHLETPELSIARTAREELRAGTPWPQVARNYSLAPKAKINNAEKYWPVSSALNELPSIQRYIATLDSGAISPIQRENGIYHFIQLIGARAEGDYSDPEWIKSELKDWLLIEKQRKHYNSYVKNLYLNAKEDNELDVFNVLSTDTLNIDKNRNQTTE
ncbi:MAG: peptidyl-prolyl cis-trans isomerase [Balneolaceae bacterium]|nr:peptidyl-prolyl cis-trans isomerase [Balneolaceae bacterium]